MMSLPDPISDATSGAAGTFVIDHRNGARRHRRSFLDNDSCECGCTFTPDAIYCRNCGKSRASKATDSKVFGPISPLLPRHAPEPVRRSSLCLFPIVPLALTVHSPKDAAISQSPYTTPRRSTFISDSCQGVELPGPGASVRDSSRARQRYPSPFSSPYLVHASSSATLKVQPQVFNAFGRSSSCSPLPRRIVAPVPWTPQGSISASKSNLFHGDRSVLKSAVLADQACPKTALMKPSQTSNCFSTPTDAESTLRQGMGVCIYSPPPLKLEKLSSGSLSASAVLHSPVVASSATLAPTVLKRRGNAHDFANEVSSSRESVTNAGNRQQGRSVSPSAKDRSAGATSSTGTGSLRLCRSVTPRRPLASSGRMQRIFSGLKEAELHIVDAGRPEALPSKIVSSQIALSEKAACDQTEVEEPVSTTAGLSQSEEDNEYVAQVEPRRVRELPPGGVDRVVRIGGGHMFVEQAWLEDGRVFARGRGSCRIYELCRGRLGEAAVGVVATPRRSFPANPRLLNVSEILKR